MTEVITLAHGNGGLKTQTLINQLIKKHIGNHLMNTDADAAVLPGFDGHLCMTTDSFTVAPLFFPGGDIGSLSVHGSLNDLAVAGASPLYLSLALIIEEGLPLATLEEVLRSIGHTAARYGVNIVCGDTKVVPRGAASELFINTTAIGAYRATQPLGMEHIQNGDAILVSGPVGDHGSSILLAREELQMEADISSDAASVGALCRSLWSLPGLRFLRDPTRGGLATVMHEILQATGLGMHLQENAVPLRDSVASFCNILGFDPYYLACEGRAVAVVAHNDAQQALDLWQRRAEGQQAAIIGHIDQNLDKVVLHTPIGGQRILPPLTHDPLPRIC